VVKTLSVRAVAVTAVVWLAVVSGTVGVEAAPNGKDTRAPAAKQSQSHQPDKRQDENRSYQPNKKQDESKSQQPVKKDEAKDQPTDKKWDETGRNQGKVESSKPDTGGQAKVAWSKNDQAPSAGYENAKKYQTSNKPEKEQPRPNKVEGKAGGSVGYVAEQKTHVHLLSDDKTGGKSGSNPDGAGVDKPYPAAGQDARSQGKRDFDGNNGCGNDADRADDNNGNCGKTQEKSKKAAEPDKATYDYPGDHASKPVSDDRPKKEYRSGDYAKKHDYPGDYNQGGKDNACYVEVDGKKNTRDNWHEVKNDRPYNDKTYDDRTDDRPPPQPYKDVKDQPTARPVEAQPTAVPTPIVEKPAPAVVSTVEKPAPSPAVEKPAPAVVSTVEKSPVHEGVASSIQVTAPSIYWGPGLVMNAQPAPSVLLSRPTAEVSRIQVEPVGEVISAVQIEAPAEPVAEALPSTHSVYQNVAVGVMPATGGAPIVPLATLLVALGGLGLALRGLGKS